MACKVLLSKRQMAVENVFRPVARCKSLCIVLVPSPSHIIHFLLNTEQSRGWGGAAEMSLWKKESVG